MSVRLKDRSKAPVKGFHYFQAETNFDLVKACPACQWSFDLAVKTLVKHRLGNPRFKLATDYNVVASELDSANALRMLQIPGAESYVIVDGMPMDSTPKLRALRSARPAAAGGGVIPKLVTGAETLIDWLGDGAPPVPQEVANSRASVCVGCKFNVKGDWSTWFTAPISEGIRKRIQVRDDMGLSTPYDSNLHVCDICRCPLKLKMHVPRSYILSKLSEDTKNDLAENAPWCWMHKPE